MSDKIKEDLFVHFRQRLRTLMFDHADTCERVGMAADEAMSQIVAGIINEMLLMLHEGGCDEEAMEEDIVESCRSHFYAIKKQAQGAT